jgi:hypothetical protein
MAADDENSQMIWYLVIGILFVVLLLTYNVHRNRFDLVGLTIEEAREKTILSQKKWGDKIGFIEPPRGQFQLLGRIASQTLEKRGQDTIVNYKLYQIDSGKIDDMLRPSPEQVQQEANRQRVTQEEHRRQEDENRRRDEQYRLDQARRREEEQRHREEAARQQEEERIREDYLRKIEDARKPTPIPEKRAPRRNMLGLLEEEKPTRANFHMQKSNFFW